MKKAIVLFTSFWDADSIIGDQYFIVRSNDKKKYSKINLFTNDIGQPENFSVRSIALSHPNLSKLSKLMTLEKDAKMTRLDFFCPTYNILKRYKNDNDWDSYQRDFVDIVKNRKESIKDWIEGLIPNHLYILCCWENTVGGANCHRQILYKLFNKSPSAMKKMVCLYRDGARDYKRKSSEWQHNSPLVEQDLVFTSLPHPEEIPF